MNLWVFCVAVEFRKGSDPFLCIGKCAYQCAYKSFKPFWFSQGLKFRREVQNNSRRAGAPHVLLCHHRAGDAERLFPASLFRLPPCLEVMGAVKPPRLNAESENVHVLPGGGGQALTPQNWSHLFLITVSHGIERVTADPCTRLSSKKQSIFISTSNLYQKHHVLSSAAFMLAKMLPCYFLC